MTDEVQDAMNEAEEEIKSGVKEYAPTEHR